MPERDDFNVVDFRNPKHEHEHLRISIMWRVDQHMLNLAVNPLSDGSWLLFGEDAEPDSTESETLYLGRLADDVLWLARFATDLVDGSFLTAFWGSPRNLGILFTRRPLVGRYRTTPPPERWSMTVS
jgi:hypothetical protein